MIEVTADMASIWHKYPMANVGLDCDFLNITKDLQVSLTAAGTVETIPAGGVIFREGQGNEGVYLVLGGKVCMSISDMQNLDRVFAAGSLLGLPSTFTGHPYSLMAVALTNVEVLHVSRDKFLHLMTTQLDLCREATEILSREVSFIHGALAERRRHKPLLA